MVRRLDLTALGRTHNAQWFDGGADASHLFAGRKSFRKIVVMIDAELIDDHRGHVPASKRQLLSGLLHHDLVRLYRYADDGPSPDVPVLRGIPGLYEGWAVVSGNPERQARQVIYESSARGYSVGRVWGNAVDVAEHDVDTDVYRDLGSEEAAVRRRYDVLAAMVAAQALEADLYVTERAYLHAAPWNPARGVTVCTIADALAILGLYLRAQGEHPVALRHNFNRGLFFWVGTRELLPEAWRWFGACVQYGIGSDDDSLDILAGSLLQRVQRALEARDAVHLALNRPQNNDTQQNALSHLDTVLVFLMAAIDVAARVAHRVLVLPTEDEFGAGWQKTWKGGWLEQVRARQSALADVVRPGSAGSDVLTIVRLLRNSVHGAALQGTALIAGATPMQTLVGLPASDEASLLVCMESLGGSSTWGVRHAESYHVLMDPGVFVDRLFSEVLALLNQLMANTPVERLPHVLLSSTDCVPSAVAGCGPFADLFAVWIRRSIRWQLGF